MASMLIAAFDNHERADMAITELEDSGFDAEEMSVIARQADESDDETDERGKDMVEGAAGGAVTGGVVGGLAGLLIGAGVLPALGGLLIGGPIAAALGLGGAAAAAAVSGAVTGAAAGGLIGALTNVGLSEEQARNYNETIQEGGVVVIVPVAEDEVAEVRELFSKHGATQVDQFTMKK